MKTVRFKYRGSPWVVYLAPEEDVSQMAEDPNCPAFVETASQEIYFSDNYELNLKNVMHEVWHMGMTSLYIESAGLDQGQTEEVSAELFAHEGETLLTLSKKLLKVLLKLKGMKHDEEIQLEEEESKDKN
jgi:hypothetical protein